ncbi:MAG TPA: ABC transporter permease, partial [Candidatus Wallbacteria bacterium]|nr:ABC transporter permease [Candidatus Wallbacteria bacterium]
MLGVIIGVAAVVSMISIGEGAKDLITSSIEGMGT